MDDNTLRNIFNKFSQGDLSATRRYGGAGLGMAITQALVRLMNGTITVSSRIGSGTVVDVKLSLEKRKAEDIVADASGENYSLLTNRKVLIVEDNELNRLVAMNVLSPFHMNITEAPNGAIAIEKARTSAFDAILMDLQMPVMDGIEATRIIRHELGQQTPVIALTANAFKAELDRCMEAGINDYITKPFDEKSLLSALLRNMPAQATSTAGEPMPLQAPLPYDLSYLNQVNRGNREMVLQIIRLFIEQTPQAINQIREAWKKNDLDTVYRLSHQIKPTIKMFGIETIGEEILSIERMSHDKQSTPELGELIGKVEKVIGSVIGQMTREELA
jgi:CheY-like chemotaxis protein/HPt (histidine-containing phosphotransfer) domain-containing protein